jgi:transglutaminase-like putative cysteine protease
MTLFLRLTLATGSVVFWQLYLRPDRFNPILWLYLFLVCLQPIFSHWLLPALLAIGGTVVLLGMLVVPYSAYLIWFELLLQGAARGTVSWTVAGLACYLSVLALAGMVRGRIYRPILLWLLVNMLLLYILLRDSRLLMVAGAAWLLYVLLPLIGRNRPQYSHRGLITLAVMAAAGFFLPQFTASGRSSAGDWLIDRHLSRGVRTLLTKVVPQFPLLYGISGFWYGNSFNTEQPGGKVYLSSRPVLLLEGDPGRAYYLKTGALDYYLDGGWNRSGEAAASDRIMIRVGAAANNADTSSFKITILDDFFPYLPHTLHTNVISLPRPLEGIEQNDDSITLKSDAPLLFGDSLQLTEVPGGYSDIPVTMLSEADLERYTALPEQDQRVVDLAATLAELSEYRFQMALADLFSKDYTYTLNPGNDRDGKSFITNFLFETREGYCVHYATAAVILARLNNIPARYIHGYLAIPPIPDPEDRHDPMPETTRTAISGLNSHAWVELWSAETGWVTFEATPPLRSIVAGSSAARTSDIDQFSRQQLSAISGRQIPVDEATDVQEKDPGRWALLLAALAMLSALSAVLYRLLHSRQKQIKKQLVGWNRLGRLLRRILKASNLLGIPDPRIHGWLLWEKSLAARLRSAAAAQSETVAAQSETVAGTKLDAKNGSDLLPDSRDLSIIRDFLFGQRCWAEQDYQRLGGLLRWLKQQPLAVLNEEDD